MSAALRPWLGLASFTEANAAQFFGREAEVAELVRRLSRKGLTVLFGQSGLGKTSMLQAGVVPRLREAGFAPVLLRMDYSAESPSCEAQMLAALGWGTSEGLWEQLHQRDREGLAPLLIFDQFEEVFTLGQADEAGRAKAAEFLNQLADLVENRVPAALEAKLDQDDSLFDRYDLQRADFRLLISLREDYLAHLEPLKSAMPGITQNRMRIAPMTGEQALQAVCGPGGELVSTDTAEAIVCFVSGAKTIQHAEVEPALLSLILRELNEQRIAKGQAQITPDLLAGSHAAILSDFYERSLSDQPQGVRHFIEDQLLTDTGYRENVAEERVKQAFGTAGAAQDALEQLVNRRLLRVEERLDRRRVELTHDTLCAVVAASRENRRERERAEAAERQAAEQQASEQRALAQAKAARATALRARWVAGVSATLGVAAIAASAMAYRYFSLADQTRSNAQSLTTYLLDDFAAELDPSGRSEVVGQLAQRAVNYYQSVPAALRSDSTLIQEALAHIRLGSVQASQFRVSEARAEVARARTLLEPLFERQPESAPLRLALAEALFTEMQVVWAESNSSTGLRLALAADALLAPLPPPTTPAALSAQMSRYKTLAIFHALRGQGRESATAADALLALAAAHGGGAGGDNRRVTGSLINSAWWIPIGLERAGRRADAQAARELLLARSAWLLESQPDHRWALMARAELTRQLAEEAVTDLRIREALALSQAAQRDYQRLVELDPANGFFASGAAGNLIDIAGRLVDLGLPVTAIDTFERVDAAVQDLPDVGDKAQQRLRAGMAVAVGYILVGRIDKLEARADEWRALAATLPAAPRARYQLLIAQRLAAAAMDQERFDKAEQLIDVALAEFSVAKKAIPAPSAAEASALRRVEALALSVQCEARIRKHSAAAALPACAEAHQLSLANGWTPAEAYRRDTYLWLALAQARSGHLETARALMAPVMEQFETWARQTHDSEIVRWNYGRALLVQALIEPERRLAHLKRARAIFDALPTELRATSSTRWWSAWINEELAKP